MIHHKGLLQLAELFNCLESAVVWIKDRDGRYSWVNRAFWMNYSNGQGDPADNPSHIIGKTDYDLSPAFLADQYRLDDEHVLAGNRIINRIELVTQPDRINAWHMTSKIPLVDERGKTFGTAGLTQPLQTEGATTIPGSEFGPVLAFMRDNYHRAVSNQQLAVVAHMSVRAFERKFQASFYLTPQKYLRKLQLRMASRSLIYTAQTVAQVAASCGFADQSHFTREFRAHFGKTPRAYRERYGEDFEAAGPVP